MLKSTDKFSKKTIHVSFISRKVMLKNIFGEVDWKKLYLIENGYTQKNFVSWKIAEKYCLTSCLEKKYIQNFCR